MSRERAPRIREQYKDNAIEVDKNLETANELQQERVRHREEERQSDPKSEKEQSVAKNKEAHHG